MEPNWGQMVRDVVGTIGVLRAAWGESTPAQQVQIYIPILLLLSEFCGCVQEVEEGDLDHLDLDRPEVVN